MTDIEATSIQWKKIADMWQTYFTPPSRVSPDETEQYRKWIVGINTEKRPLNILLLGATPEIRDVLSELKHNVTIIDINPEMVNAMNLLLSGEPKEKVVIQDWLETSLPEKSFDVVIGDAVFPNIPWKNWSKLLVKINKLLKLDGFFLTRAFNAPAEKPYNNMNALLDAYSNKDPSYKTSLEFTLDVMNMEYNQDTHEATFRASKDLLESIGWDKGKMTGKENLDKILEIVWNFWVAKFVDKIFIYAYRSEEEALYKAYFTINDVFESSDNNYHQITPMYKMKPLANF